MSGFLLPSRARGTSSWQGASGAYLRLTFSQTNGITICGWCRPQAVLGDEWQIVLSYGTVAGGTHYSAGQQAASGSGAWGIYDGTGAGGGAVFANGPSTLNPSFLGLACNNAATTVTGWHRRSDNIILNQIQSPGDAGAGGDTITISNSTFDGTDYWLGKIWNVRAWHRVLTATELLRESFSRIPVSKNALIGWWPLEGSITQLVRDFSGNNNHLTLTGSGLNSAKFMRIKYSRQRHYRNFSTSIAGGAAALQQTLMMTGYGI